ncbi:helix-turn-helix transcriptional regulator [Corallococcus sp. bb12-1]|uniref:helix-turn-helix domain-containing protein n=1 Tax=Corallococcus sp. bb12-1 TaxID=2996784 RepID=UPI00226FA001|nr:helix-turn-helix transcriptional regulator [Corallococcus sp. bb12-1]MCY1047578.1 helix-turn-helix transcriptional regulator [Corallococcus sp. bb12-1]
MSAANSLVGPRVRQLRAQSRGGRGMTQEELAEVAGISVSFVSMVERGERHPRLPMLEALARALGTTVADLVSEPRAGEDALSQPLVSFIHAHGLSAEDVAKLEQVARLMFPLPGSGEGIS